MITKPSEVYYDPGTSPCHENRGTSLPTNMPSTYSVAGLSNDIRICTKLRCGSSTSPKTKTNWWLNPSYTTKQYNRANCVAGMPRSTCKCAPHTYDGSRTKPAVLRKTSEEMGKSSLNNAIKACKDSVAGELPDDAYLPGSPPTTRYTS